MGREGDKISVNYSWPLADKFNASLTKHAHINHINCQTNNILHDVVSKDLKEH